MKRKEKTVVGIAWYRLEQWADLKEFCEDRYDMDATYDIWRKGAEKAMNDLRRDGQEVEIVDFDLDKFKTWCLANQKRPVAASRSEFTVLMLRDAHTQGSPVGQ